MGIWIGWRDSPLIGFDLETDSPDPQDARIITASVGMWQPGSSGWTATNWLIQPERPIPAETTAIHGIKTEQARKQGRPRTEAISAIAGQLTAGWLINAAVCGFNVGYDLTVLARELGRIGADPLVIGGMVIDPFIIDKAIDPYRRGSRKLADVCRHWDVLLTDAHSADADALAATRLAWKMAGALPVRPNDRAVSVEMGVEWQADAYRQQRLSLARYFRTKKGDEETAAQIETDTEWPMRHYINPQQELIP